MALARFALKNQVRRVVFSASSSSLVSESLWKRLLGPVQKQGWEGYQVTRGLSAAASGDEKSQEGREVTVSEGRGKKWRLFPRRNRRRGLWRNNSRDDFVPSLYEFFPSGLGDALVQATQNINRVLENIAPSGLIGRLREKDDCYKLRYEVPGLAKEDVKITVDDGVLTIKGEHEEEEEEGSDDEHWSAASYGYYNTSLMLPEDAKPDEIRAEMKDGILTIVIPKAEKPKREVKEVKIQ
ncbi:hypothetical protein NMG60_11002670 [Bertholletia excelsa]